MEQRTTVEIPYKRTLGWVLRIAAVVSLFFLPLMAYQG